nr:AAA-associated domain-containing protein [Thermogemmatispora onikobensis]
MSRRRSNSSASRPWHLWPCCAALRKTWQRVDAEHYLERLHEHSSEGEAEAQLQTIIEWEHYAEIFTYQEEAEISPQETDAEREDLAAEAASGTREQCGCLGVRSRGDGQAGEQTGRPCYDTDAAFLKPGLGRDTALLLYDLASPGCAFPLIFWLMVRIAQMHGSLAEAALSPACRRDSDALLSQVPLAPGCRARAGARHSFPRKETTTW